VGKTRHTLLLARSARPGESASGLPKARRPVHRRAVENVAGSGQSPHFPTEIISYGVWLYYNFCLRSICKTRN